MGEERPKRSLMEQAEFDVQIDEYALDEEWTGQPSLYFRYAAMLADAKRDLDEAKNGLEVVKAETARAIRSDPQSYGLAKVTENSVAETVPLQQGVKDSQEDVIQCRHRADVVQAAVAALDHRKKGLEKLVELSLANYFSKPRVKGEEARQKMDRLSQKSTWSKGRRKKEQGKDGD